MCLQLTEAYLHEDIFAFSALDTPTRTFTFTFALSFGNRKLSRFNCGE